MAWRSFWHNSIPPVRIVTDIAFACTAILEALLAPLISLVSPLIADLVDTPELERVMRALAPVVALKALEAVPLGLMVRAGRFRAVALSTTLTPIILVVLGFQSLHLAWHPWSQLLAAVLPGLSAYAVALIVVDRPLVRILLTFPSIILRRDG